MGKFKKGQRSSMLYGFDYFIRFGTAAGPDHATMPRLRYDSIKYLWKFYRSDICASVKAEPFKW